MTVKMKCGATTRSGGNCERPAGWGTDHVGQGRCKLHGGLSPKGAEVNTFKTGRYSKYLDKTIQEKLESFEPHDLFDLADELQTQRALIAQYLERYQNGLSMSESTIHSMMSWFNSVGVMVERIMKIRNEDALTSAELAYLKMRTADLVVKYIDDPAKRRAFVVELFQISEPAQLE